jgi:UDP-2,4-diacetamido-2,4,6-trideoxy-beta-L-altropyranose hydrolase
VLDGYQFDSAYQRLVKDGGHRLMVIDDLADLPYYYANAVLNQNIHAENLRYCAAPDTRLFLGTRYVLLRRDFREWSGWHRTVPEVARRILVTLGGGDADNATLKVIRAFQYVPLDDLEITVLIGASNQHYDELRTAVRNSRYDIRLEKDVTDMARLMSRADVAVSAAGTTCLEMAFMRLPSLLIVLADNQSPIAEGLDSEGAAKSLGWQSNLSPVAVGEALTIMLKARDARGKMARRGHKLVDGLGTTRMIRALADPDGDRSANHLSRK